MEVCDGHNDLGSGLALAAKDVDDVMGYTVNVDVIVPRFGGQQVFEDQRVLSERIKKALGPIEEGALRNQPDGMRVQGFFVEWY